MPPESCKNLEEAIDHPQAGYLLNILHIHALNDALGQVTLRELFSNVELFRRAVKFLFLKAPQFDIPEISGAIRHVEKMIVSGHPAPEKRKLPPPLIFQANQTPIPDNLFQLADLKAVEEDEAMTRAARFYPETVAETRHSRALDRCLLNWIVSIYTNASPSLGPKKVFFDLLRETPALFTSLGFFLRDHFPGIQLVDVGAGTGEGIVGWAELLNAKACIYVDSAYKNHSYEKRGETDFYKLKGDALQVVSHLPDGIGSFHLAGIEIEGHGEPGKKYLSQLAKVIYAKTAPNGLFLVGQIHCDMDDLMVTKVGFSPIDIPKSPMGLEGMMDWRERYKIYRKNVSGV